MSRETPFDWDRLIESVVRGRLIPVGGHELLLVQNYGSETLHQRYLAEVLQPSAVQLPQEEPLQFLSGCYLDRGGHREDIDLRLRETMNGADSPSPELLIDEDGRLEASS